MATVPSGPPSQRKTPETDMFDENSRRESPQDEPRSPIDPLWDDEADAMEDALHEALSPLLEEAPEHPDDGPAEARDEARRAQVSNAVADAVAKAGGRWNVLPGGVPGACQPRLLVVIDRPTDVAELMRLALEHVTRHCRGTRLVLFYLTAPHRAFREAWPLFRHLLAYHAPGVAVRVAGPARLALCFFDERGAPVSRGAPARIPRLGLQSWWRRADPGQRARLIERVQQLRRLGIEGAVDCAFIRLHTAQPTGCANGPDLSFGLLGRTKIVHWVARIYLIADSPLELPIGFPAEIYRGALKHPIVRNVGPRFRNWRPDPQPGGSFPPFEWDPWRWIDREKLLGRM
jgi:hypothetical protein